MICLRAAIIGFMAGVVWLTAWVSPGLAQSNAVSHSPAKVAEKYFALDNKGCGLTPVPSNRSLGMSIGKRSRLGEGYRHHWLHGAG